MKRVKRVKSENIMKKLIIKFTVGAAYGFRAVVKRRGTPKPVAISDSSSDEKMNCRQFPRTSDERALMCPLKQVFRV